MAHVKFFFCEGLQKNLKVWVTCDYIEALHIEMHVHTSNLGKGHKGGSMWGRLPTKF